MINFPVGALPDAMKYIICSLVIYCLAPESNAQPVVADTAFASVAARNTIKVYEKYIEGQELIYSGSLYKELLRTNESHPYFLTAEWTFESVRFEGEKFDNVPLLYDIIADLLITESVTGNTQALPRDRVDNFSIQGHFFERVENKDFQNSLPRSGFFEVLYNGKTKVLCLRQKQLQEKADNNKIEMDFYEKWKYFVLRDGRYFQVKSKSSIIKLLADRKAELRSFVKRNNHLLTKNPDVALPAITREYDSLTANKK
jgi:hypothetical protein